MSAEAASPRRVPFDRWGIPLLGLLALAPLFWCWLDFRDLYWFGDEWDQLDQIARHGLIDLDIQAEGDLHIDGHHTVEDVGIALGQAVFRAVGDKTGIRRYGHAYVPLDEALSRVVIDFSGRPGLVMNLPFKSGMIGSFDSQLAHEFFQGFVNHAFVTLHIDNLRGENAHHQAETVFKAFARALRMALEVDPRAPATIPSTKGSL